jgi:hypothetical protein
MALKYDENAIGDILQEAEAYFTTFKGDREDIDEEMQLADYMYAAAQNRALTASEKVKGANLEKDSRASVGSTIFHRQVNMLAAQLVNVINSQTDLVRYQTISNEIDTDSAQDGKETAAQMQVLQRYTRKRDHFDFKIPEFAVNMFKKSTAFIMINWCDKEKTISRSIPVAKSTANDDGSVSIELSDKKIKQKINLGYPSIKILDPSQVYADRWIPNLNQQNCVIVTEIKNRAEVAMMVNTGEFDRDQYEKLDDSYYWNMSDETDVENDEALNREKDRSVTTTKMFRLYHIFMLAQLDDAGQMSDEAEPELYYIRVIGNDIKNGMVMSIAPMREYDPDGEIPIVVVNANPDKFGELYHTSTASVVRSAYSTDCTLLNLAIDNMAAVNDPPLMIIDGAHRVKDFTFKKGQRWHVDERDAITQFQLRDVTQNTSILREQVRKEAMQALATDAPMMGEFAGARTSASEFVGVNQNTKQPHLVQINYILQQFLPWWGKKIMSYWMYHGNPKQVLQITDMQKQYQVQSEFSNVEFDVEVNIVQEYEDNLVRQQQLGNIMQIIGSSPFFQQSEYHSVNPAQLLKKFLNTMRWDASEIIDQPTGFDAEANARRLVEQILLTGEYQQPDPRMNISMHLKIARGEEIRWRGLEGSGDPRAANVPLLQQYIAELQLLQQQGPAGAQQLPQGQQNQTQGEVTGNQSAAALGQLLGG